MSTYIFESDHGTVWTTDRGLYTIFTVDGIRQGSELRLPVSLQELASRSDLKDILHYFLVRLGFGTSEVIRLNHELNISPTEEIRHEQR